MGRQPPLLGGGLAAGAGMKYAPGLEFLGAVEAPADKLAELRGRRAAAGVVEAPARKTTELRGRPAAVDLIEAPAKKAAELRARPAAVDVVKGPARKAADLREPPVAGAGYPRHVLRVLLPGAVLRAAAADVTALRATLLTALAAALAVPSGTLRLLGLYGGTDSAAADVALCGAAVGEEAVAAARLASHVAALGDGAGLLRGAKVQLLMVDPTTGEHEQLKAPWQETPIAAAAVGQRTQVSTRWEEPLAPDTHLLSDLESVQPYLARPPLSPAVEALLAEAERISRQRRRGNTRLELLEAEQRQRKAVITLVRRWRERKQRRLHQAATRIQRCFRAYRYRRAQREVHRERCAIRLQRWWRRKRARLRWHRAVEQLRAAVRIQKWWRGCMARAFVSRRLVALAQLLGLCRLKLRCARVARRHLRRRDAVVRVQAAFRGHRERQRVLQLLEARHRLAVMLQAALRTAIERGLLRQELAAAVVIQARQRGRLARALALRLRAARDALREAERQAAEAERRRAEAEEVQRREAEEQLQRLREEALRLERLREQEEEEARQAEARRLRMEREAEARLRAEQEAAQAAEARRLERQRQDASQGGPRPSRRGRYSQLARNSRASIARPEAPPVEPRRSFYANERLRRSRVSGTVAPPTGPEAAPVVVVPQPDADEAHSPAAHRFARRFLSRWVELSPDGLSARHNDPGELHGVVFCEAPVALFRGAAYFEVRVDSLRQDNGGHGLTLGMGLLPPGQAAQELPATAADVPQSWSLGYSGHAFSSVSGQGVQLEWDPRRLAIGDRVGLLVDRRGELLALVNKRVVAKGPEKLPTNVPLYPFVDLQGVVAGVSLMPGARPSLAAFAAVPPEMAVTIEHGGLVAARRDVAGDGLHTVVFGDAPLPRFRAGRYFEVRVERVGVGRGDGLALGVAEAVLTGAEQLALEAANGVPRSWSVGYSGLACTPTHESFLPVEWSPKDLRAGDRVGFLLTAHGEAHVYCNGQQVAHGLGGIPVQQPLFAFVNLLGNTLAVRLLPDAEPPELVVSDQQHQLTGFAQAPVGSTVMRSPDGGEVFRVDEAREDDSGVVFGDGVVPRFNVGSYYAVRVTQVRSGWPDGLVMGVTTALPRPPEQTLFAFANDVPNSWGAGYDGRVHAAGVADMLEVDWNPQGLRVGDEVGLLVTTCGEAHVLVNERLVLHGLGGVPWEVPLYAVIDLLGNTAAVSMVRGAAPPREILPVVPAPAVLTAFSPCAASGNVLLSEDRLHARHRDASGNLPFGVVFGDGPLPRSEAGWHFEVRVEETCVGHPDGLVLGVSTRLPRPPWQTLFQDGGAVTESWSLGYDGRALLEGAEPEGVGLDWNPKDLRVGDRVVLLVTPEGELRVHVNGALQCRCAGSVPVQQPLFPFVDLLGNTTAVSLWPQPAQLGVAPAAAPAHVGPAPVPPVLPVPAAPAVPAVPATPAVPAMPAVPPLAPAPQEPLFTPAVVKSLAFDATSLSSMVQIDDAGHRVWHTDSRGEQLFGVVLSEAPLPRYPEGRYFEVVIDRVRPVQEDGLAIGVTATAPGQLPAVPELADEVTEFWLAGYDGCFNSIARRDEQLEPLLFAGCWHPAALALGAHVGVLATDNGELLLFENGELVVKVWDAMPPAQVPLYALLDLMGRVSGVSLALGARPPTGALRTLSAFDRSLTSHVVEVSPSGLEAEHTTASGEAFFGVVFGDAPLPLLHGGAAYFEVRVHRLRSPSEQRDGLVIGLTTARPSQRREPAKFAEEVPQSWSVGYDGYAKTPSSQDLRAVQWDPRALQLGDRVGFLVAADGFAGVFVNGQERAQLPEMVTVGVPLYGFVDLTGTVQGISLVRGAVPPDGVLS